jgi:hypothetical protein
MAASGIVLKVAISFSNRNFIGDFEPGTASYERRLLNLKLLSAAGIPTSVTIKPILESCSADEYGEILADCSPFIKAVTVGGEYLDATSVGLAHGVIKKPVTWLQGHPIWPATEDRGKIDQIGAIARDLGISVFESDASIVEMYLGKESLGMRAA